MAIKYTILVAGLFIAMLANASDSIPKPFTADYSLHSMGTKFALMTRNFTRQQNGEYLYHSETNTTGLLALVRKDHIVEQSVWRLDEAQLKPLRYSYIHNGGKKDRNVTIEFDWKSRQISTSVNGTPWQMPIQPGIMDKLLYQLAIMHDLGSGKETIEYTIADGGKIKTYNFDILGEERISTPLGEFLTVKLERHKPNSKRLTTLWCARELDYLPVKVVNIENNGRETTAIIESLSGMDY